MAQNTPPESINPEELAKSLSKLNLLSREFTDYSKILVDSVNELARGDVSKREALKSFKSLYSISSQFRYEQEGSNRLSKKEIENNITRLKQDRSRLDLAIQKRMLQGAELKEAKDVLELSNEIIDSAEKRLELENEIQKKIGVYGTLIKGISKLPVVGGLIDTKNILDRMYDAADAGGSSFEVLAEGIMATGSEIANVFKDPLATLIYLVQAGLKADEQTTKLAKTLTQTKTEAAATRDNLADMARASGDNFLTTEKLVESTLKLGQQLGIASTFSGDLTKEFSILTGKIGLSEEAAGGLAKASIITGRSLKSIKNEAAGAVSAISAQYGVQLDIKDVLEEAGKASSLLLANFKGNPVELAKAVAEMKELGTSLETTQKQANALLDWQTSIQNTLEASLITGRNINLDKARELALNNDLVGAAKELVGQQMNYNTFSEMNAIQRSTFAKSLGLETQELSDQLLKLEYMGKSRKEVAALAGEEAAKRLEALSAQDKFNQAVQKLQDIFVSLIDGPIGQLLDLLTDVLGLIGKIGAAIAKFIPAPVLKILAGAGAGFLVSGGNPIGALVGGLAVAGNEAYKASTADDLMSGYGERTLITPQGSYALNNNDTVIAGTNLFRGNDVYSGPQGAINMTSPEFDYGKLAQAMSSIRLTAVSKPSEFAPFISKEQNKSLGVKI
jgi:hypothetical protein